MGGNCCTRDTKDDEEEKVHSLLPKHPRFKLCQIPFPLDNSSGKDIPFYTQISNVPSKGESASSKIEMRIWTLQRLAENNSRDIHALQLFLEDYHCIAITIGNDIGKLPSIKEVMSLFDDQIKPILQRSKGSVPIYMLMESHCPYLRALEEYCLEQDYEVLIIPPFGINGGAGIDLVYTKISKKLIKRGVRPKAMKSTFVEMGEEEFAQKLREDKERENKINLFSSKMKSFDEARYQRWDSKVKKSILY